MASVPYRGTQSAPHQAESKAEEFSHYGEQRKGLNMIMSSKDQRRAAQSSSNGDETDTHSRERRMYLKRPGFDAASF